MTDCVETFLTIYKLTDKKVTMCLDAMEQKGMTFDHNFYVVVVKQCRTENAYARHQHNIFI